MADIVLTLPCPLCLGRMLTAIYEPQEPAETPLLAEVSGCPHAEEVMADMSGVSKSSPRGSLALWEALLREAEMYCLDQYTDALESSTKYRRLREED